MSYDLIVIGTGPGGYVCAIRAAQLGLKTAVVRIVRARQAAGADTLSPGQVADFCASFQRVVVETLLDRTFDAARRHGAVSIGIAGGVSANSRLREEAVAVPERIGERRVGLGALAHDRDRVRFFLLLRDGACERRALARRGDTGVDVDRLRAPRAARGNHPKPQNADRQPLHCARIARGG